MATGPLARSKNAMLELKPATRHAIISPIVQDDPLRVLDRRRLRRFDLVGLVHIVPTLIIFGTGFYFATYGGLPRIGLALMLVAGLYFVAWLLFEIFLGVIFAARCFLIWLRDRIDRRTDSIVKADDPEALFVKVIPRANWKFEAMAMCTDVGFLVIDSENRELRYEGDIERWTIPAEAIRSFQVHSIVQEGWMLSMFGVSVVLMWVELPEGVLREIPLATQPIHIEPWTPRRKRERARVLAAAIGNLVDPQRWPAADSNKLRRIRPPPRAGEVRDLG
jgi:hypothetical protein